MVPAGSINIRCALFQCMLNGRLVLWDILRIFGTLRMQSQGGRAGKWASHGWAAWERLVRAVGLSPEAHLLTRSVGGRPCVLRCWQGGRRGRAAFGMARSFDRCVGGPVVQVVFPRQEDFDGERP